MTLTTLFACLLTAGLTVWLTRADTPPVPDVFIPERLADQSDGYLMMMGGWITEEGYQPPAPRPQCGRDSLLPRAAALH